MENLKRRGIDAIYLREPTGGVWGKKIREIASGGRKNITPLDELEYFINDREEDVRDNVIPALDAGRVVVMDRYIFSNMAYQGALGLDIEMIREKNRRFPQPDLVLFLDLNPRQGLSRIDANREGGTNEGYEKEDYLQKVYAIYKTFDFMERIDAGLEIDEIQKKIVARVLELPDR